MRNEILDDDVMDADVVLLGASSQLPDDSLVDRSSQLWVLYLLESPSNTAGLERFNGKVWIHNLSC